MNRRMFHLLLAAGLMLLIAGCSKKSSDESCIHQASMDLDAGNYDAVIASSCADAMQRGAAYFGKAGFDTKVVINKFIQTGNSNNQSGGTSGTTNLTTYMTDLVGTVDEASLTNLDSSAAEYTAVPASSEIYKDAQFNLSLVTAIKSLSLMKLVISDLTGTLNTSCDINADNISDNAEAESCALIAANNIDTGATTTCGHGTTYTPATPTDITITGKSATYSGLVIDLTGTGTGTCPSEFRKLLYKTAAGKYFAASTSATLQCTGSDGGTWPCPIEQNGTPLDLVTAIDTSLNTAVSSLNTSLTTTSNVQQSITNIQAQACPTGTCTSSSIADYLQTIKK